MNTSASCAIWTPRVLSILRIVSSYMLLIHGTAKLFGVPHAAMFDNLQIASLSGAAAIIELIFGGLLLVGLFTRPAAFIVSGFAAAAYFIGHVAAKGNLLFPLLNGGEAAVLYCFVFLYIWVAGPGPWSLDAMMRKDTAS
ncbi:DoxX family protein [Parapusillimonas granuli]|uniref:DoxX family protein n=1 Tax=Parapusillimonas granuli TaxID=380911 RepID=A0A853FYM2_9BURK|nr:DoxX family protein [Parapusillimonas granuli]MBB5215780.1 putative oxidoreductase [Parapusillimonas granuli]MEB2399529.1 DoxX family protein [Alcaligenaceae bacterium]NYT51155.1 DoxX family protein [Parapusillimonas granuli]